MPRDIKRSLNDIKPLSSMTVESYDPVDFDSNRLKSNVMLNQPGAVNVKMAHTPFSDYQGLPVVEPARVKKASIKPEDLLGYPAL